MLCYALLFFLIALVATVFGLGMIAAGALEIAKIVPGCLAVAIFAPDQCAPPGTCQN
nr:DUF1328 family protein [Cupriavidus campinensis]